MNSPSPRIIAVLFLLLAAACSAAPAEETPPPAAFPPYQDPCAATAALAFEIDRAALAPFAIADGGDSPYRLRELGGEAAQTLADGLQPAGSICALAVSADTGAVIEQSRDLGAAGKNAQALHLLEGRLQQLTALTRSGHLVKPHLVEDDWRNRVRDILAMAAAAYDLGGDPQPFYSAAADLFRSSAASELAEADLRAALRIEAEAELFADEELAGQARQRAGQIAAEMIDAALEDFDPCAADRAAVVDLLNTAAQATLLGVDGMEPGEARYEAVKTRAQQALSQQWNAYVRQKGLSESLLDPVLPCRAAGELDVKVFSICSQNWISVGKIPFDSEPGDAGLEIRGQGHIAFSEQSVIGNELDCSVSVDAEVILSGKFLEEEGVRRVEFTPSFSSDGNYRVIGRTTPIRDEGVYPFNGYGSFIMPWVDGSVHPASGKNIIQYVLHISAGQ